VNDPFSPISDEDVRQIAQLMETLENSSFDYLQVQVGDLKVTLGKGEVPPEAAPAAPVTNPAAATPTPVAAPAAPAAAPAVHVEDGTVAITSPLIGRFYTQSEPGADAFVAVGDTVGPDSTVALIEVMKLFTAIPAGRSGTITEICVANKDIVEYGQVLFRVKPS
jgi:acetyl-CoA carboxylase biotin carboxyl carrier protein